MLTGHLQEEDILTILTEEPMEAFLTVSSNCLKEFLTEVDTTLLIHTTLIVS